MVRTELLSHIIVADHKEIDNNEKCSSGRTDHFVLLLLKTNTCSFYFEKLGDGIGIGVIQCDDTMDTKPFELYSS